MSKILCSIKMLWTVIQFKASNQSQNYWAWLFDRTSIPDSSNYRNKCSIVALFGLAYQSQNYAAVCQVYDAFRDVIIENGISDKYAKMFMKSAYVTGREDIPKDILGVRASIVESS